MSYTVRFEYQETYAEVAVWDDEKTATLGVLFSKFRNRGAGRKMLEKAILYCETFGLDLFLEVQPFGDGPGMSPQELKAFYRSLGFESHGGSVMVKYVGQEGDANEPTRRTDGPADVC